MSALPLKPAKGGFLRPFGSGEFIHQFLLGKGPYGSAVIYPQTGPPQAEIFREYKLALMKATALDKATKAKEKQARLEKRYISPDNIVELTDTYLTQLTYKAHGCRFHSFVDHFSGLRRLGWVEATG
ncbi:MAG: hypothetical protein Q7T57_02520 [Dehalococcoidales bacterium]|nr:hypothetical protein [Dehalococcoidales bacterium]